MKLNTLRHILALMPFASVDPTKRYLAVVNLKASSTQNEIIIVATDGHKLLKRVVNDPNLWASFGANQQVNLWAGPQEQKELKLYLARYKNLSDADFMAVGGQYYNETASVEDRIKVPLYFTNSSDYIRYEAVIPSKYHTPLKLSFNRKYLEQVLKSLDTSKSEIITMEFNGQPKNGQILDVVTFTTAKELVDRGLESESVLLMPMKAKE